MRAAQSARSGSKNSHCTCGKAARKPCSTRLIDSISACADGAGRIFALTATITSRAELLREQVVDGLDFVVSSEVRAHALEDAALDALADQQLLHLDADEHRDEHEQHADADRAGSVPRRVAGDVRQRR